MWLNLDPIVNATKHAWPSATIVQADMASLPTTEQILFWHQANVVVAIHGAARTNAAFLQPTAVLVEIFSPNYKRFMFGNLTQRVGAQHLHYTCSNNSNNETVHPAKETTTHENSRLRNVDLQPHPAAVWTLIRDAVQKVTRQHSVVEE